jgi:hypothetical protein
MYLSQNRRAGFPVAWNGESSVLKILKAIVLGWMHAHWFY